MNDPHSVFIHIVWAHVLYKVVSILSGLGLCYFGYRLHVSGVQNEEGEGALETKGFKVALKRFAPGTYMAILGTFVLYSVFDKGMETNYENQINKQATHQKQEAPPPLPAKDPFS